MPPKQWRNSHLFENPPNPKDKKKEPDISDLAKNDKGWCELLTKDNLCGLWLKFGRDSLPPECKDFPQTAEQVEVCKELRSK